MRAWRDARSTSPTTRHGTSATRGRASPRACTISQDGDIIPLRARALPRAAAFARTQRIVAGAVAVIAAAGVVAVVLQRQAMRASRSAAADAAARGRGGGRAADPRHAGRRHAGGAQRRQPPALRRRLRSWHARRGAGGRGVLRRRARRVASLPRACTRQRGAGRRHALRRARVSRAGRQSTSSSRTAPSRCTTTGASATPALVDAGQRGRIDSSGAITVADEPDLDRWTEWTRGGIVLDGMTLGDAARELGRRFGVQVEIRDDGLARRRVSARFHDEPLPRVLDALTVALGARWTRDGAARRDRGRRMMRRHEARARAAPAPPPRSRSSRRSSSPRRCAAQRIERDAVRRLRRAPHRLARAASRSARDAVVHRDAARRDRARSRVSPISASPTTTRSPGSTRARRCVRMSVPARDVLLRVLEQSPLRALVSASGQIVLVRREGSRTRTDDLRGSLRDAVAGTPLAGARVELLGTRFATYSRESGEFSLGRVPSGRYELRVLRIGYEPLALPVRLPDDLARRARSVSRCGAPRSRSPRSSSLPATSASCSRVSPRRSRSRAIARDDPADR